MTPILEWMADKLKVRMYETRVQMGADAAKDVAKKMKELLLLDSNKFVNIIFAAAPSQNEFLCALSKQEGIEWTRVNAFHMDEYVGLENNATQTFSYFLKEAIFDKLPFNAVHFIHGSTGDPVKECHRYADLLNRFPADIVCMGIGENTHIAFNDPHTADFNDPMMVKLVTLDQESRQQQVNDGCFNQIEEVPTSAITLTVPALLKANSIYCMVPGKNKANAVYQTLHNEVSEQYPATSLKLHSNATLYVDRDSALQLRMEHMNSMVINDKQL